MKKQIKKTISLILSLSLSSFMLCDYSSLAFFSSDEDDSNDEEENEDIYDDVVTKDELVDALDESIETKNTDKLKMLLDQENLNRIKERIKKNEELKKKMDSDEDVFDE